MYMRGKKNQKKSEKSEIALVHVSGCLRGDGGLYTKTSVRLKVLAEVKR